MARVFLCSTGSLYTEILVTKRLLFTPLLVTPRPQTRPVQAQVKFAVSKEYSSCLCPCILAPQSPVLSFARSSSARVDVYIFTSSPRLYARRVQPQSSKKSSTYLHMAIPISSFFVFPYLGHLKSSSPEKKISCIGSP